MNGLTYFRLKSQYDGDITKNCALDGFEVDNNFYTLEGRDIKAVSVEGDDIVITLVNGETIKANNALENNYVENIDFDKINGVLKITQNGITSEIKGFATNYNVGNTIAVDGTLQGDGRPQKPVGISPLAKSGQYRPVERIVRLDKGERLPDKPHLVPGERILTAESVSNYGFLYNYNAVKKIACDLRERHSEWRIPTKEDWDDMLNAVEPVECDKNHESASGNKYLGKWAGKLLKSHDLWKPEMCHEPADDDMDCGNDAGTCINYDGCDSHNVNDMHCSRGHHDRKCHPKYCGEYGSCHHKPHFDNGGLDKYGFRVTPAGYADDGENYLYFRERACFWTASNSKCTSAYVKRFEFDKSRVHQDVIASQNYMSLRLVKDYNGTNFNEREDILGSAMSTCLMPSVKNGHAIWTSVNVALGNKSYEPLMPNDGQGLTFVTHYYINEWDGHRWVRNELKEGESVVVKHSHHDKHNVEYRVVHNELVNVATAIYHDVMETVHHDLGKLAHKLDTEIDRSIGRDNELDDKISQANVQIFGLDERLTTAEGNIETLNTKTDATNEHLDAVEAQLNEFSEQTSAAIESLNAALNEESETRRVEDEKLANAIEAERVAREDVEAQIWDAISKESAAREDVDNQQWTAITNETAAREDVEGQLWTAVNNETAAREDVDNQQWEAIQKEAEARTDVDNQQWEAINNETTARESVEAQIWEAVNNEIERSIAKDEELEAKNVEQDGKLLTQEGTFFNKETGVLTLKSAAGTNDITVQFSGCYGTF